MAEVLGRLSLSTITSRTSTQYFRSNDHDIKAMRYEETMEGKAPLSVTVPPPRAAPPIEAHPALRRQTPLSADHDHAKRDSGLAPTTSTPARKFCSNNATNNHDDELSASRWLPKLQIPDDNSECTALFANVSKTATEKLLPIQSKLSPSPLLSPASAKTVPIMKTTGEFSPITTLIPNHNLIECDFLEQMEFSKRGSMLFGGCKAVPEQQQRPVPARRQPSFSMLVVSPISVLSTEAEVESQKVRSMYEPGELASLNWRDGRISALGEAETVGEEAVAEGRAEGRPDSSLQTLAPKTSHASVLISNRGSLLRREYELAGGLEDWEDIHGEDVDRYGFISVRRDSDTRPNTPRPKHVSTVLQLATDTPRQDRRVLGRAISSARSTRSLPRQTASRKVSGRSLKSLTPATPTLTLRSAVNHLPGHRDRRWVDEAGDMLTLPPGLSDIAQIEGDGKAAEILKLKELARAEKWRKMAKVVKNGKDGEGMEFEFDVKSSKLIERTWKGIPDRWRATAWFAFLSASAKKRKTSATDAEIVAAFRRLLDQGSADDTQIDIDVPRTINSHIMFRTRYRGGQRLLFRVLHCLSLYFPETGYVQGMASLAATLLCYYDEEKCFVMLVRMWQLRGLQTIYAAGFDNLLAALREFHEHWLAGTEIASKLDELNIEATAYCTRWYLTLFNLSIPFAAQLRVWDVFMLLGDADYPSITPDRPFGGSLDVIHAVGSALIEGTREILLDSDFENAMKVLTSWIPVKDEDMLMNITKLKFRMHHGKKTKTRNLVTKSAAMSKTTTM